MLPGYQHRIVSFILGTPKFLMPLYAAIGRFNFCGTNSSIVELRDLLPNAGLHTLALIPMFVGGQISELV